MTEPHDPSCQLCRLVYEREILTRLVHEDDIIIVVDCLVCNVPMPVLKAHRASFSVSEKEHIRNILREIGGGVIDWEQRKIHDHAHCHHRPAHFPGTRHWEEL